MVLSGAAIVQKSFILLEMCLHVIGLRVRLGLGNNDLPSTNYRVSHTDSVANIYYAKKYFSIANCKI